ncbi:uncharacterized protein [Hetaerina americana]|uniref:uncharacterized protein isoform X2 n=1 Tax=Hetaerina americana TaxID=62018 RepID=UPI003A7F11EF
MAEDRFNTRPKWISACGAHVDSQDGRQNMDGRHSPGGGGSPLLDPVGEHLTDEQLISGILIEAKDALMHAEMWRREYVNQTFNVDFVQHHEAWRTNRYSWLPTLDDIPKELEEQVPEDHLETLNIICEIEVALIEKGEKVPIDVQRNIMPKEFRSVSHATHRNLRDWLIFRDYMNGVEYVIQVFEFLKTKLEDGKA